MAAPVLNSGGKRKVGDGTPGPGRPKGLQNRQTRELKDMILTALGEAGGVDYLATQAKQNPAAFLTLVGKVLPMTVKGTGDVRDAVVFRWAE